MRNVLAPVLGVFLILLTLHGCTIQSADPNEGLAQEEAATQELEARQPFRCAQPITTGVCRAYFERYAFDAATGRCVKFIYGGCGGNENNFESYGECWRRCERFVSPF